MAVAPSPTNSRQERELMARLWSPEIKDDLYNFVMFCFPWGKKGTPLEKFDKPRSWQTDELNKITEHIKLNKIRISEGLAPLVYQSATASGRGPGKSALTAWLNIWMMSTRLGSTCINSANTEHQLKSRTWAELGKWHTLAINSHWFEKTALSLRPAPWFEDALKKQLKIDTGYFYSQAQLWSEENPDAFAGVHNYAGLLLIFDEASGIPAPIWKVSEGFFTEPVLDRYWFVFSNPRRASGTFYECFHKFRDYWNRRHIDSRDVEGTDKKVLNDIIEKYGEDSDEARIEVKGQFPRMGDDAFISRELIQDASERELLEDPFEPLIMGVDPARKGNAKTVIRFRQGRDARSIPAIKLKGKDNMEVADICAFWIEKINPDAVCIDAGNGTGIIDRLKQRGFRVHEVWFGSKSSKPQWGNKRAELWADMRDWLYGGCIDKDADLISDLAGPERDYLGNSDKQILESKDRMESRGIASPDDADALACTFAVRCARRDSNVGARSRRSQMARDVDYDILG